MCLRSREQQAKIVKLPNVCAGVPQLQAHACSACSGVHSWHRDESPEARASARKPSRSCRVRAMAQELLGNSSFPLGISFFNSLESPQDYPRDSKDDEEQKVQEKSKQVLVGA